MEAIWQAVRDLAAPHEPQEVRHAVLKFLSALIRGQYQTLGPLKGYFFEVLSSHQVPEDLMERFVGTCVCVLLLPFPLPLLSLPSSPPPLLPRLELLQVLTEGGRAVDYIDSGIGPLMVQWMPGVMEGRR